MAQIRSDQRNCASSMGLNFPWPDLDYGDLNDVVGHLLRHAFVQAQKKFSEAFDRFSITSLQYGALEIFEAEICWTMTVVGLSNVSSITRDHIRLLGELPVSGLVK